MGAGNDGVTLGRDHEGGGEDGGFDEADVAFVGKRVERPVFKSDHAFVGDFLQDGPVGGAGRGAKARDAFERRVVRIDVSEEGVGVGLAGLSCFGGGVRAGVVGVVGGFRGTVARSLDDAEHRGGLSGRTGGMSGCGGDGGGGRFGRLGKVERRGGEGGPGTLGKHRFVERDGAPDRPGDGGKDHAGGEKPNGSGADGGDPFDGFGAEEIDQQCGAKDPSEGDDGGVRRAVEARPTGEEAAAEGDHDDEEGAVEGVIARGEFEEARGELDADVHEKASDTECDEGDAHGREVEASEAPWGLGDMKDPDGDAGDEDEPADGVDEAIDGIERAVARVADPFAFASDGLDDTWRSGVAAGIRCSGRGGPCASGAVGGVGRKGRTAGRAAANDAGFCRSAAGFSSGHGTGAGSGGCSSAGAGLRSLAGAADGDGRTALAALHLLAGELVVDLVFLTAGGALN